MVKYKLISNLQIYIYIYSQCEHLLCLKSVVVCSGVPRNFVGGGGGFQQIQLRTEDRENGDLGAVAP